MAKFAVSEVAASLSPRKASPEETCIVGEKSLCSPGLSLAATGCPKGESDYSKGRKAETLQDYDAALEFYQKALKSDPNNASYKIRYNQTRFDAAELRVKEGFKLREKGDLDGATAQFERAQNIDPSSPVAGEELKKTLAMIGAKSHAADASTPAEQESLKYMSMPPQIKPLSTSPITYKASQDLKMVFDTIGKLAGLTIIYDQDIPQRRIAVDLSDVTSTPKPDSYLNHTSTKS